MLSLLWYHHRKKKNSPLYRKTVVPPQNSSEQVCSDTCSQCSPIQTPLQNSPPATVYGSNTVLVSILWDSQHLPILHAWPVHEWLPAQKASCYSCLGVNHPPSCHFSYNQKHQVLPHVPTFQPTDRVLYQGTGCTWTYVSDQHHVHFQLAGQSEKLECHWNAASIVSAGEN